jgi:hypothetical protein
MPRHVKKIQIKEESLEDKVWESIEDKVWESKQKE